MFSPLKNLLNFIQKSGSGAAMFSNKEEDTNKLTNKDDDVLIVESSDSNAPTMHTEESKSKTDKSTKSSNSENALNAPKKVSQLDNGDIEAQIKTIVIDQSSNSCDHNQNHRNDKGEMLDISIDVDEYVLASDGNEEDMVEDLVVSDEEEEAAFVDLTQEIEEEEDPFISSEVIVLSDAEGELNASFCSEAPSEDPLAFEDPLPGNVSLEEPAVNPLETSINDAGMWPAVHTRKSPKTVKNTSNAAENNDAGRPNGLQEHAEEMRGDGSDSGLGSENTTLHNSPNSTSSSAAATPAQTPTSDGSLEKSSSTKVSTNETVTDAVSLRKPRRSNLKRRLDEDEGKTLPNDSNTASSSTGNAAKRAKRSINFDTVEVYYFQRQQGFGCVPSAGGCTLGMSAKHVAHKTLSLTEHAAEIRRAHRAQLQDIAARASSSDDTEESEEDYLTEGSSSELDAESSGYLQPVSPKTRRQLLKAAGVRKIDASEKFDCRNIRNSREVCGCSCRNYCDPDTCACSLAGIKCQVDRAMFPCGCARDACGNTVGRVEFNPTRVRTHYIHTLMRLEMENRHNPNTLHYSAIAGVSSTDSSASRADYYGIQSNYSSGYASPTSTYATEAAYYNQNRQQTLSYNNMIPPAANTQQYQIDSVDCNNHYNNALVPASPTYTPLVPTYNTAATAPAVPAYHMNYPTNAQVPPYSVYPIDSSSSNYVAPTNEDITTSTVNPSDYSSDVMPVLQHYGSPKKNTANTCREVADKPTNDCSNDSLANVQPITNNSSDDGGGSSFIDLDTPIASSSRMSQINDLLQHNRNTTAVLVPVSSNAHSDTISLANKTEKNTNKKTVETSLKSKEQEPKTTLINLPIATALGNGHLDAEILPHAEVAITQDMPAVQEIISSKGKQTVKQTQNINTEIKAVKAAKEPIEQEANTTKIIPSTKSMTELSTQLNETKEKEQIETINLCSPNESPEKKSHAVEIIDVDEIIVTEKTIVEEASSSTVPKNDVSSIIDGHTHQNKSSDIISSRDNNQTDLAVASTAIIEVATN